MERFLTAQEVAELLGVKPWRVYDLVRQRLLPAVRLGRQMRFDPEQIRRWAEAGGTGLSAGWRR